MCNEKYIGSAVLEVNVKATNEFALAYMHGGGAGIVLRPPLRSARI